MLGYIVDGNSNSFQGNLVFLMLDDFWSLDEAVFLAS
jgi:hypothetical protein